MPVDQQALRNALAYFPSGVCIVNTVDREGRRWGFTASSFCALSLNPPLVLVCLDKRADCYEAFMAADHYSVSVLASHQLPLAMRFATKEIDKFEAIEVIQGVEIESPLIPEAAVHLECRMYDRLPGGDHTILVGEVVAVSAPVGEPLVHHNRRYGVFQYSPAETPS